MIRLRPTVPLGALRSSGLSRLGDVFLRETTPGLYRISDTDQDAALERPSTPEPYRLSDEFPGNGGIVTDGSGFFRILG